jgi:hypothetical protein
MEFIEKAYYGNSYIIRRSWVSKRDAFTYTIKPNGFRTAFFLVVKRKGFRFPADLYSGKEFSSLQEAISFSESFKPENHGYIPKQKSKKVKQTLTTKQHDNSNKKQTGGN